MQEHAERNRLILVFIQKFCIKLICSKSRFSSPILSPKLPLHRHPCTDVREISRCDVDSLELPSEDTGPGTSLEQRFRSSTFDLRTGILNVLTGTYKEQYCFSRDFKNRSGSSVPPLGNFLISFPRLNGEFTPVNLRGIFLILQSPSSKEIGIFP